ncbi:ABC-2 type transport system permease protein [Bacillus ectoiniformans]|uniref:DUF6449 domain-containing protein n=1 Tax=Bacillus ectoiniformans TaxID=1494429 RepID=UPI00195901BF|nr:DUF6449 domain-containing protein [Bacillus ectoiniformans]MBM7649843.1 ABC-2 type transport system permease protein [Bacillus ectoiniformans]
MQLATLFFNKGLMKHKSKAISSISVLYFLLLFFAIPLQMIMMNASKDWIFAFQSETVFALSPEIQSMLIIAFPIALAIFTYRYLHVKSSADFMHSLPVSRYELFIQFFAAGVLMMVMPVAAIAVITGILQMMIDVSFFSSAELLNWSLFTIFWNVVVFSAAVFAGMLTGLSIIQAFFTLMIFMLPAGISMLLIFNLKFLLKGFAYNYYLNESLEQFILFFRLYQSIEHPFTLQEWSIYGGLAIIFAAAGLFLYKKRATEAASQAIAFRKMQPLFIYGFTFCSMLIGSLYFGSVEESSPWILAGALSFASIGYFIARMIVDKSVYVLKKWRGLLFFLLSSTAIVAIIQVAGGSFERNIPAVTDVKKVYVAEHIHFMTEDFSTEDYKTINQSYFFEDPVNVKNIIAMHEKSASSPAPGHNSSHLALAYQLENGKQLIREYEIPESLYKELMEQLAKTAEYKENFYPLLRENSQQDMNRIVLSSRYSINKQYSLTNQKEMEEFIAILKMEMKNESPKEMTSPEKAFGGIEIMYKDQTYIAASWKKSYKQINKWLSDREVLNQVKVMPEDVDYAVIAPINSTKEVYDLLDQNGQLKAKNQTVIKNKDKIEQLIEVSYQHHKGDYAVAYYMKNQPRYPDIDVISKETANQLLNK